MLFITKHQARRFLLLKHGLLGEYIFEGKQGVIDYIRQTGCIQFDPIDICGKNAELTLQSRVKNFSKNMLYELLYEDRVLLDYPDKNTAIILAEDWPFFARNRNWVRKRAEQYPELKVLLEKTIEIVKEKGVVCSDDVEVDSDFQWRAHVVWSNGKKLSSSLLEQLYGSGDLIIHHKKGTRKYYDLTEKYIPQRIWKLPDPFIDEKDYLKWRVLRFIGAVGLLWNRPSDALPPMKADLRNKIFSELCKEGCIIPITVEGIKHTMYCLAGDMPIMEKAIGNGLFKTRCEFIAPLDCFIWDRKIIQTLFDFDYTWEIYTPVKKRKYGHYVLPILMGERFIGRIEAIVEKEIRTLVVKNLWYEEDVTQTKEIHQAVEECLSRFSAFNDCDAWRIEPVK